MMNQKTLLKPINLKVYNCDVTINGRHFVKLKISSYYQKHNWAYLESLRKKGIKPSKFLCNYPHTIHKQLRLVKQLGVVDWEIMMKVRDSLKIVLNLDK